MTDLETSIAVLTANPLIALDLTATIEDLFPAATIVTMTTPVESVDEITGLPRLLAVVLDQAEARSIDLHAIKHTGAAIIVLGESEAPEEHDADIAYLQLPFTTEMLAGVLESLQQAETAPES